MKERIGDPQGLTTKVQAMELKGKWLAWCDLGLRATGDTETDARTRLYVSIIEARDRHVPRTTGALEVPRITTKRKR